MVNTNGVQVELKMATTIAERIHAGQMYGKHPYMYHLNSVVNLLMDGAGLLDERLPVIGMLHDTIEDTKDLSPELVVVILKALFEDNIVNAVIAMSKIKGESKEDYLARVKANPLALKVKMYDTLCNLTESLHRGDQKRIAKYSKQMAALNEVDSL